MDPSDQEFLKHFNYFNYFTEVEDEFVRRRGSHLMLSPLDWSLMESWKEAGMPLPVVLRGITRAFDAYDARKIKFRKVNNLFFCQQLVELTYADYRLSQVGGGTDGDAAGQASGLPGVGAMPLDETGPGEAVVGCGLKAASGRPESGSAKPGGSRAFSKAALIEFIQASRGGLERSLAVLADLAERRPGATGTATLETPTGLAPEKAPVSDDSDADSTDHMDNLPRPLTEPIRGAIERAMTRLAVLEESMSLDEAPVDAEALEIDLEALDRMLLDNLTLSFTGESIELLRAEAKAQLRSYRKKMDRAIYEQTLENFVARRMRGILAIPRLSLFYMI